jgi:hypothetical protein
MTIRLRTGTPKREAEPTAAPPPTLRARPAGFAPVADCVAAQDTSPERSVIERILGIGPLRASAQALFEQALLEQETAALLARLPADWTVLHSVPAEAVVIPHLVVGPAGVFAVFPQRAADASVWVSADLLSVDGAGSDAMRTADGAAGVVEERLAPNLRPGVEVVPVVVFSAPRRLLVRTPPDRVQVLAAADLTAWLRSLPEVCSALIVDRLADAAELPATWGSLADPGEGRWHRLRLEGIEGKFAEADRRWRHTAKVVAAVGFLGTAAVAAALAATARAVLGG